MRRLTRAQRREQFLQLADTAFDRLEEWCEAHPQASFGEIEAEARQQRRALMGQALAILINGRDNGVQIGAVRCTRCGAVMEFHEYRAKTVRGLEGDTCLQRAYYVCSAGCGETFFPPGPEAEAAEGSVE